MAVFAVSELRLGVEGTEWQSVGFDLDCRATTLSGAEGSCENGNTAAEDGLDGRDSGFGQYLGPTLSSLTGPTAAPTSTTNQAILGGEATLLVELGGYSSDNPDDADVSVRLSPSPGRSGEAWLRLDSEAVSGRVFEFDEAYVVHHVVVARAAALDFMMRLKWSKGSDRVVSWIDTTLHQVVLTLDLRKYAKDSSVSVSGMLGAVWRPRELKLALAGILYDVGICPQTLDSGDEVILDRVDEALDIRIVPDVSARPAGRPMLEPCQAVSFGLGFKASLDETTDEPIPASKPLFSSSCLCSNEPGAQAAVPPDRCWDVFAKSRLLGTAGAGP